MIVGGKSRGGAGALGVYLGTQNENEQVQVLRVEGFAGATAASALRELDAMASGTRIKRPVYHAWLNPPPGEQWTPEQLQRAVDVFLEGMGWQGQPYVLARHRKDGEDHYHLGVSRLRVSEKTGRIGTVTDSLSYRKHQAIAEQLGREFGYAEINRAFERDRQDWRDRGFSDRETFAARQRGQTVEDLQTMRAELSLLYQLADTGRAFYEAARKSGFTLAKSGRGAIMAVDPKGGAYAVARMVGRSSAEVRSRLEALISVLPSVEEVRDALRALARGERRDRPEGQADPRPGPADGSAEKLGTKTGRDVLDELTRTQSTFTQQQLDRAITKAQASGADGRRLMAEIAAGGDMVRVGLDRFGRDRFTTLEVQAVERRMAETAAAMAGNGRHNVRRKIVENVPTRAMLNEGQAVALAHVTSKGDLKLVEGFAGTGKSTMLGAAREAWEAMGFRVRGMALAGIAAEGLEAGSGIESRTIHSALWRIENGKDALTKRDVIVVDEAGMIGSRLMEKVLAQATAAGSKVVLVGDSEQLQAIDAGAAFRALRDAHGAARLDEIHRQREDWQKEATRAMASGHTGAGLDAYQARRAVHEAETSGEAKTALLAAWANTKAEQPEARQIILAYTNADVRDLNREARAMMRQGGALGADIELSGRHGAEAYAAGDRLYFLKNDALLKVRNGSLGTIQEIDGRNVKVKLDDGRAVQFDAAQYQDFAHGYAATIHKSQGATVDRAHVLASQYMDRHAAYVAMSRHKASADLYYSKDEFSSFDQVKATLGRDRSKDTTLDYAQQRDTERPEQRSDKTKGKSKAAGQAGGDAKKTFKERPNTGQPVDRTPKRESPDDRLAARLARKAADPEREQRLRKILDQLQRNGPRNPRDRNGGPSM